ncbi:carboxypeptidase-like regulatory domain-containing protein [Flavobacterium sp. I3-2]|uniref:carboxypeptidase-like regulatory domain-containing protein n=1 Tax=Flavobacterium sp. I3-2 TaxID=2748319 RepID=UPI0015B106C6|nr:carboxypeptidase-like regulatory domain-containing protein [Flavobacterium sp. I3-2]
MKKWCLLFLILPNLIFSQINGVVVDENNKPLSYVNIWNKDLSAGATSNIEGKFLVEKATEKDTLVLSLAGYETRKLSVKDDQIIKLKKKEKQSNQVVENPENKKTLTIGKSIRQNLFFSPGNLPWIYAKYFKNDSSDTSISYLNKVEVFIRSNVANATFKLRFFKANLDGTPGEDLLIEPLVVHPVRDNRKNTINLLEYKIKMPETGVFVGIEWLLTENNRIKLTAFYKGEEAIADYRYAPDLVCNQVEESNAYRYVAGEWKKNNEFIKKTELDEKKPIIEPAINLILSN